MNGLILHCGAKHVSRAELREVPAPPRTSTYTPVRYADLVDYVHERIDAILGLEVESEYYGLARDGAQFFGAIRLRSHEHAVDDPYASGLAIGMRSSDDRSLSVGLAIGESVFVCDNLAFSGSSTVYMRRHTTNAWGDICGQVNRSLRGAPEDHRLLTKDLRELSEIEVDLDAGYAVIGRAVGHGLVKPRQAKLIYHDWRAARDFPDRTAGALYQHFTHGMKLGGVAGLMDRLGKVHRFFMDDVARG